MEINRKGSHAATSCLNNPNICAYVVNATMCIWYVYNSIRPNTHTHSLSLIHTHKYKASWTIRYNCINIHAVNDVINWGSEADKQAVSSSVASSAGRHMLWHALLIRVAEWLPVWRHNFTFHQIISKTNVISDSTCVVRLERLVDVILNMTMRGRCTLHPNTQT